MLNVIFDTLEYVHKLKEAGVPEKQAETHVRILSEVIESNLATKQDIAEIKRDIKDIEKSIEQIRADLTTKIEQIRSDMSTKIELERTKSEIIKWVAGMLIAQAIIIATLVKLL